MNRKRWQRIAAILDEVLERHPSERAAVLEEACAGDPELRAEVEALLAADEQAGGFLMVPAGEAAAELLEEATAGPEPDEPLPEHIGPYRIEGRLGQGGMGEVYRGYDGRLHRAVALKRVRLAAGQPEQARQRFQREARAMARLSHSAVVQVYDWAEGGGADWIIMELVEGRALRELLAEGPLRPGEAVRIGRAIAAGLAAAHAAGVVHRDLKTNNVMVTSSGQIKILDFGIARHLRGEDGQPGEEPALTTLTGMGKVVGTVAAMSPEQALGQPVDHRSDLFSLGSLLYQLLTGESPFQGRNEVETLSRICTLRQVPVVQRRPEVPPGLSTLIDRLLEKEPDRRPGSADEVAETLDRVAAGLPSGTAPVRRTRRRWALAAATMIGAAVVVLALQPAVRNGVKRLLPGAPAVAPAVLSTPYEHYQQGMASLERYYRPGQIDRAIESFQRAIASDTEYAPAYNGLARAYWRKHRAGNDEVWLEQARGNVLHALELDEHLTAARVSLALIDLARGEREAARRELEQVLVLDPANPEAHRALGDYHRAIGSPAAAEASYREALELRPDDLDLHSALGVLKFRQGSYAEAEAEFSRVIELDPAHADGYKNLAAVEHMQGRYSRAATLLQKALEIEPDGWTYANLGTLYFFQGLYQQALAALKKAVELGASDHQVWGNLGDAYRWTPGHADNAREAYRTAIHLLEGEIRKAPQDPVLRARLAQYLAKRGDRDAALRELAKLQKGETRDAGAFFKATQAAEIAGARGLALDFLRQTLDAGYSQEEIRRDPELIELRKDSRFYRLVAASAEARKSPSGEPSER